VTLNQTETIRPERILERVEFHHPIYAQAALDAHARISEVSGRNRTSYCGAYWGFGFHEDGVKSALDAAAPFGVTL
jgi:predicted NAD/FAD-binding protein